MTGDEIKARIMKILAAHLDDPMSPGWAEIYTVFATCKVLTAEEVGDDDG